MYGMGSPKATGWLVVPVTEIRNIRLKLVEVAE